MGREQSISNCEDVGEGQRKWSEHSKGPRGIKLITLQGRWSGHLLELRRRERSSQGKGMGRESVLVEVTEQPSSGAKGEGEDGIPTEGVEVAPKRAITHCLQVLGSAGRFVSA